MLPLFWLGEGKVKGFWCSLLNVKGFLILSIDFFNSFSNGYALGRVCEAFLILLFWFGEGKVKGFLVYSLKLKGFLAFFIDFFNSFFFNRYALRHVTIRYDARATFLCFFLFGEGEG